MNQEPIYQEPICQEPTSSGYKPRNFGPEMDQRDAVAADKRGNANEFGQYAEEATSWARRSKAKRGTSTDRACPAGTQAAFCGARICDSPPEHRAT